VLVERDHLLASLTALGEQAVAGRGALVFLGGEAGVGKTSLSAALADRASALLTVRRGGCDNVTTADALGPLIDAVPELTSVIEDEAEVNRLRLFRRLSAELTAKPTLLLLEDVHWADEATLEILRFLGRRIETMPLLVVATYREDEVVGGHPLTVVLGDLATAPGVRRMQLGPLTEAGVARLIEAAGSPLDAGEVHRSTGGNAFYVSEVLATGDQRLPATVRDAVLARASRLSPGARQVLAAAAVVGQRAELGLLVAVSGQPAAAVDECVRRGMLVGTGQAWAFRHELARLAIEQTLTPTALVDLHAAALRALQVLDGGNDRRLAHHAAGSQNQACVLLHAPRAATRAARLGAHREAAEQYRLALRFTDSDDLASRAHLFAALSYECYLTDQLAEAYATRQAAMELSVERRDWAEVGAAQRWLSRLSWFLGNNAESRRYAGLAVATLEPLGDGLELAMAYSNQSQLEMLSGDLAGAVSWGNRAIELARRLGEQLPEIHALNNIGAAMGRYGDALEGAHRLARSLDLALAADAHEHAARAYTNLGSLALSHRRLAEADRHLRAGIVHSTERGLDSWRLYMSALLASSLAEQGRYQDADEVVRQVLCKPKLAPTTRILVTVLAGQLAARRGEDATPLLAEARELATPTGESQRLVPVAVARAEAAWLAGRTETIVAEIDGAWAEAVRHPCPWDLGELSWWLSVGGERRQPPVRVAEPFSLMLDGHWQAAADEWLSLGCPLWAALALSALPELTAARQALELVEAIGAPATRQALLRDRHARGLSVPRGPRAASRANPSGLTRREIDVLRLLAGGLSNAEVADQLFLSEKTVGHHVSSVLHKLGEPTRSRAVATAIRQGIVRP
jgi:DNA-binding CsgD family transcriptional regulator/tetratricopeptide (TPR) repeat protein